MNNESPRHSTQPGRPVAPPIVHLLRSLHPVARRADCAYFVGGATARDLMLVNLHGLPPGRATLDVDFGIAVESWDQFARIKEGLIATGRFQPARRMLQRLVFSDRAAGFSIPVDLIPFRGVASADSTIAWPPGRDVVMSVAGFEEALTSSVLLEIGAGLIARVASVPGLALLKLIAWSDRGRQTNKDAIDLYRLLLAYADAGNTDRLYEQELVLLEAVGFNLELAGAELLGRDVAGLCSPPMLRPLLALLESEPAVERLIRQMAPYADYLDETPVAERAVRSFSRGFLEHTRAS